MDGTSRILIVGTSGAGKSTLARRISAALGLRDIELDALFWKENWTHADADEFRRRIEAATKGPGGYVLHGNYNKVRDLTWGNADTVVWLDYSRWVVMWRVLARTIGRIITKEVLWAGNRETFRNSFLAKDAIVFWAWNTFAERRAQYSELHAKNPYNIKEFIVLKAPREAEALIKGLEGS